MIVNPVLCIMSRENTMVLSTVKCLYDGGILSDHRLVKLPRGWSSCMRAAFERIINGDKAKKADRPEICSVCHCTLTRTKPANPREDGDLSFNILLKVNFVILSSINNRRIWFLCLRGLMRIMKQLLGLPNIIGINKHYRLNIISLSYHIQVHLQTSGSIYFKCHTSYLTLV